ncbi:hypothetical protein DVH24_005588 [Malus domestica]|uniref:Uncharacterized protein n=1 Tax=Malus domestica TaxID=3750 RepID=A0A498IMH0_MALDO|nr:hypothetical protein DVH24_005588 [Malus domestica]
MPKGSLSAFAPILTFPPWIPSFPAAKQLPVVFRSEEYGSQRAAKQLPVVFRSEEYGSQRGSMGQGCKKMHFGAFLEHFWAKIGWCKHGDMRMDEFDDSKG